MPELDRSALRIAIVHDWLVTLGGAELVVDAMLEAFPQADVYTLLNDPQATMPPQLRGRTIHTSALQKLPGAIKHKDRYFPLMPFAIEQLDLRSYDLILSSSHAFAKGVLRHAEQLHLCYCHSPVRYGWDLYQDYVRDYRLHKGLKGLLARAALHYVRLWDAISANRVDGFLANSRIVARRIHSTYRRDATVLCPPVDTDYFTPAGSRGQHFLTVARLVPYKRIDLLIEAFRQMPELELRIIGDGPQLQALRAAAPANVQLLGHLPRETVRDALRNAQAFLYAAYEDFGIAPLEAQACGTPVIAYAEGGTGETVRDLGKVPTPTGVLFPQQSADAICTAVRRFQAASAQFSSDNCRHHAEQYSRQRFISQLQQHIAQAYANWMSEH